MNTPSNESRADPGKTWTRLVADARRARPPTDIDVRHSVRAALIAEAANPKMQNAANSQGIIDDLVLLTQSFFMRIALSCCAALASFSLWSGMDAAAGLGAVADLQGSLFFSSYINP